MSINVNIYRKIGYKDVYTGMVLRIITEGPGVKSDIEGTVHYKFRGGSGFRDGGVELDNYDRVIFKHAPSSSHILQRADYAKDTTVELYEVIEAIPDEPKGVGAVVRVVNLDHPDKTMEAVKIGQDGSWVWEGTDGVVTWDSITERVLSHGYGYIKVLSEGVEL